MKKLITMLFGAVLVFSLAMPVFAQDASQDAAASSAKPKKEKKMKKMKKEKKSKKEKKADEAAK